MVLNSDFIVNRFGSDVTLTVITRTYDDADDPREPAESESTSTIKGLVQWVTGEEDAVKSGILQVGDAVLYVPVGTTIVNENQITYESEDFRVVGVVKQRTSSGAHYLEVRLKRLS